MSIEKRGKTYRVKVFLGRTDGKAQFESKTFSRKSEAAAWELERQARLDGRVQVKKTFGDALAKYSAEVCPSHKGCRWEQVRIKNISKHPISSKSIQKLVSIDIIEWRDYRLKSVSESTVLREMKLLNSVLEEARKEWRWIRENPMKDVTKPTAPKGRKRRISQSEIDTIVAVSGYTGKHESMLHITVAAFLFAIETAMRSGEILGLTWDNVLEKKAILHNTKNGDSREVPLSPKARVLLAALRCFDKPFPVRSGTRDALFRKLVVKAGILNLRFHDSRAEAIYRLSRKMDVLELARVVGHQDINSLRHYYNTSADELADRL